MQYVNVRGRGCWWWMRGKDSVGYGMVNIDGQQERAHRIFHTAYNADIPTGLVVMHLCGNRACVNPNHLLVGTQADNMRWDREGVELQHCQRGHELSGENLVIYSGNRNCLKCLRKRIAKWRNSNRGKVDQYHARYRLRKGHKPWVQKTQCVNGHPWLKENRSESGCKLCARIRAKAQRDRNRVSVADATLYQIKEATIEQHVASVVRSAV